MVLGTGFLGGLLAATAASVALALAYPTWLAQCDLTSADEVGQLVEGTWRPDGGLGLGGSCYQPWAAT